MKKLARLAFLTFLSTTLLLSGCVPEPVLEIGDPPTLPPLSTFAMDFTLIEDEEEEGGRRTDQSNFAFSASIVRNWKLLIDTTLSAPIQAFREARNYEPNYDHTVQAWVWEYDFVVGENIFNARLQGRANSLESRWEMFVTDAGAFSNFKWFTGQTEADGLSGTWTIIREAGDTDPFIRVDWNRIEGDAASNIRYRIVTPLTEETGSYCFFQRDDLAEDFTRKYFIFSKHFNNETDILWDHTHSNGQVRDFRQYNNNDFQCWDSSLQNKSCIE